MYGIVVHGGAINPLSAEFNRGVSDALLIGRGLLDQGGKAIDAVAQTIVAMEDNPIFNAGTGSWANLAGDVEMDAIIVDGSKGTSGAVACIRNVQNPILVARKVMEETDHTLLAGEGATRFARTLGFGEYNPLTKEREATWKDLRDKLSRGEQTNLTRYWSKIAKFARADTVGCVALDRQGGLAAGTSSGGFPMKLPGRIGDVPILNASTFASRSCGVSLTGHGEIIVHHIVARRIHDLVQEGMNPQEAIEKEFREVLHGLPSSEGVLMAGIVLNDKAEVGVARNVDATPHAYIREGMSEVQIGFGPQIH
ncbi:MAG: isoaspartyl peptidase/L-asparaginase [Thaumarchaeota archaeon]|nr:isoaspartyl peptidase/L-asparaginase [Nitrososphaerota archaeon]